MLIPPDTAITFFLASVMLALAPGPDNIFVMTQAALHGRNSGLLVTLGLCTGLIVHTTAVAVGVATLLQASSVAFTILKFTGAAYLLYLAWQAFIAKSMSTAAVTQVKPARWMLYRRGIIMNVTNPKVTLFFLAFLPQFTDPGRGHVMAQIAILGGLFIIATLLIFGSIAMLAGTVHQWFGKSPRVQIVLHRIAGLVYIGIALKLLAM